MRRLLSMMGPHCATDLRVWGPCVLVFYLPWCDPFAVLFFRRRHPVASAVMFGGPRYTAALGVGSGVFPGLCDSSAGSWCSVVLFLCGSLMTDATSDPTQRHKTGACVRWQSPASGSHLTVPTQPKIRGSLCPQAKIKTGRRCLITAQHGATTWPQKRIF